MNADLSFSISSHLYINSFQLPSVGKMIHKSISWTKKIYADVALKLVGIKDLLLARKITLDKNFVKDLHNLNRVFSLILPKISDSENQNLIEIKESISLSLNTIDELFQILEERRKYEQLKRDMYQASLQAINSNLSKYQNTL